MAFFCCLTVAQAQCPTVLNPNQFFCDNPYPTIASLSATNNGGGVVWYDTATSTLALSNSIALVDGGDYFADDNTGTCGSRQRVVVTIFSAPIVQPRTQGFCEESTISDLQAIGNMVQWYAAATGGTPLPPTTILTDNTLYYASQISPINGCETSRRSVLVLVRILPAPTGNAVQEFCAQPQPTVANLAANGTNIRWYLSPSSGVELGSNTPLIDGQTYYAASSDDLCESLTRLGVLVDFTQPNNAGTSGQRSLCISSVAATPPFNLYNLLGGSPDTTGTWSGPLITTNGHLGTVNIASLTASGSPYIFTYVVAAGICPSVSSTVTINILPLPLAALPVSDVTICSGQAANIVITGTPNATVTYTVNGAVRTIQIPASGSVAIPGNFVTTTQIRLVNVASLGTPSCSRALTQLWTINVLPLPTAVISVNPSIICSSDNTTVTFTGSAGATVTYTENGVIRTIVLNNLGNASIIRNLTITTTYIVVSVASAGTPSCTQTIPGQPVVVTVIPPPTANITVAAADICLGSNAIVTITGTPNATVIYTVNGATRTAVLNASGNYTVPPATYTENTVFILVSVSTAGTRPCTQILNDRSANISVRSLPTATITLSAATICLGGTTLVQISGTPNADVIYTQNGVSSTIRLNASGIYVLPAANYNSQTTFVLVSITSTVAPFCSQILNQPVILNVIPLPTVTSIIAADSPICANTSTNIRITGTPTAIVTYTENGVIRTVTLNAQGFIDIMQTFSTTTTFNVTSIVTAESPGCSQPVNGLTVTVVVIPLPIANISASASAICSGQNVVVTITGTPNATVVYTVNGSTQTIVLNTSGNYTVPTTAYTADTEFVLVSISTNTIPACPQPLLPRITISVLPLPTAEISVFPLEICANEQATLSFIGTPNAVVTYTANGNIFTITLNDTGQASTTISYAVSTRFELVSAATAGSPGCSQTISGTANLNVIPLPMASIVIEPATICSGGTANVTITGTPNAQVTYSENGTIRIINLDASGIFIIPGTFTAAVRFILISVAATGPTSCIQILNLPADLTVVSLPTAAFAFPSSSICSGSNLSGSIVGTPGSIVTYTQNGTLFTVTLNSSGVYFINGNFTQTTTFILTNVALPAPLNCSQTLNETKIIGVVQPPIAGNNTAIRLCGNSNPIDLFLLLGPSAQTGGTWSPQLASGTGIFDPSIDPPRQYQYIVTATAPCPNAVATVGISIERPVNAGDDAVQNFCSNQDSVDLFTLLGPNAQMGGSWAPALASGTGIFDPGVDAAQIYTYTVRGTFPCSDDQATVTTTIIPGPNAGLPGNADFCVNSAPADLFLSLNGTPQIGGTWSPVLSSGTGVFNPSIDTPGIYTYTFEGNQPCDDDTATVTVTINPIPDAGEDAIAPPICSNFPVVDLFSFLTGTPQSGGVWNPALSSGSGIFNPQIDSSGIYTYTVGSELCQRDSATVTITVTRSPNAGGLNAPLLINACVTNTSINLFTGLNGTQDAGGVWTDANGATVSNTFNAAEAIGSGPFLFTYTVTGGVSPCISDAATVTVLISQLPNAGTYIGAPQNFCNGVGTINLFSLIRDYQAGGDWADSNDLVVNSQLDISGFVPRIEPYRYTYVITNTCGTDRESVEFIILPNPILTTANIRITDPVCVGSNATVNLSGISDGNYLIVYNLSESNILTNETVNVTISGSVGSFLINAANIANIGATTINFINFVNLGSTCVTDLSNVIVNFNVRPLANLENANLTISNICFGSDATVQIVNAVGLSDGNYQFNISMPQAVPPTASTSPVTITGGNGNFILPSTFFPATGTYTFTITNISSLSAGCGNPSEDATTSFEIYPMPNLNGANASASSSCVNLSNEVFISNAIGLADGSYNINYQLSGSNIAVGAATVVITSGDGSFIIPASQLSNTGNTILSITQIVGVISQCGATGTAFNPVLFVVSQAGTPTIINSGNEFCAKDNPTVANLSDNISGSELVIWYDAAENGTAYSDSDLLIHNTIYYASFGSTSGCESLVRLQVTVDLTKCDDILIPDGFSPNNDGINDQFVINALAESFPNFKLEIYNRYGNILYKGNISTPLWDGTSNEGGVKIGDNTVPAGVYFYILEFNDGIRNPKQGRIYLSR